MARPSIANERREEILEAFEVCALEKGLEATTLTDVAEQSGLPRSLVRHFMGNRADMVTGLIDRMMSRAITGIQQAFDAPDQTNEHESLKIVLTQSFMDPVTNRLMIQLWQQSWHDEQLYNQLRDVYERCVEQIHNRVFPLPTANSKDLAHALTSMALGNADLSQFAVHPVNDESLVTAGKAITKQTLKRKSR